MVSVNVQEGGENDWLLQEQHVCCNSVIIITILCILSSSLYFFLPIFPLLVFQDNAWSDKTEKKKSYKLYISLRIQMLRKLPLLCYLQYALKPQRLCMNPILNLESMLRYLQELIGCIHAHLKSCLVLSRPCVW